MHGIAVKAISGLGEDKFLSSLNPEQNPVCVFQTLVLRDILSLLRGADYSSSVRAVAVPHAVITENYVKQAASETRLSRALTFNCAVVASGVPSDHAAACQWQDR